MHGTRTPYDGEYQAGLTEWRRPAGAVICSTAAPDRISKTPVAAATTSTPGAK